MPTPVEFRPVFQVNTGTADNPLAREPEITGLSDGRFLITWVEAGTNGVATASGTDIVGQFYTSSGFSDGPAFALDTLARAGDQDDFEVVATNDGGFLITFRTDETSNGSQILTAGYDASAMRVNTNDFAPPPITDFIDSITDFIDPQIAFNFNTENSFFIFTANTAVSDTDSLFGRVLPPSLLAQVSSAQLGNDATFTNQNQSSTAYNVNNEIVAAYLDGGDLRVDIYSETGVFQDFVEVAEDLSPNATPRVVTLSNGNIVVTWSELFGSSNTDFDVKYRVYDRDLNPITGELDAANTGGVEDRAALIALPQGGFFIAWDNQSEDKLQGQAYTNTGAPDGSTVTLVDGPIEDIELGVTIDGRILFTYENAGNIFAGIADPRGDTVNTGDYLSSSTLPNFVSGNEFHGPQQGGTINGVAISETIFAGNGNTTINGGGGFDSIVGGLGDDVITVNPGDTVSGGFGADTFIVQRSDVLPSSPNVGLERVDIDGDSNVNVLNLTLFMADVDLNLSNGEFLSSDGNGDIDDIDVVLSGSGNDRLVGDISAQQLNGGSGNDTILSGFGNDTLIGGIGNDLFTFSGGQNIDEVHGGSDTDTVDLSGLTGTADDDFVIELNLNQWTVGGQLPLTITGIENIIGSQSSDQITGADAVNHNFDGQDGNDTLFGASGNDTIIGGLGDDSIGGGAGNDVLFGADGDDTIDGGRGNDSIEGGNGDDVLRDDLGSGLDTLNGGDGDDTLFANFGSDAFDGGADNDTYQIAGSVADTGGNIFTFDINLSTGTDTFGNTYTNIENVNAGQGNDTITGDGEVNVIDGGAGNDTINGGSGIDVLRGGDDNDLFVQSAGDGIDNIDGGDGIDTFDGSAETLAMSINLQFSNHTQGGVTQDFLNIERVFAGQGNDFIFGFNSADFLSGGGGIDRISGRSGNDTLNGGASDDILEGGIGADTLDGGSGSDTAAYSFASSGVIADLGDAGSNTGDAAGDSYISIENLIGSSHADTLRGDEQNNLVQGGLGADIISGGVGNDTLNGGQANDVLSGGTGDDSLSGGIGNDTIYASAAGVSALGTDTLFGGEGNDSLVGSNGRQEISGGTGNDTLTGGNDFGTADIDTLRGGDGDDLILSGQGAVNAGQEGNGDLLFGDAGNDTLIGGQANDVLSGGIGDDSLSGGIGNDTIEGGFGEDLLEGGAGDDVLRDDFGSGDDTLNGGAGNDTLFANFGSDSFDGGADNDTYQIAGSIVDSEISVTSFDINLTTGTDTFGNTYTNIENVNAGQGNDTITGDSENNAIDGGAGNDVLSGGTGNDTLTGGNDSGTADIDTLRGGDGDDLIMSGQGAVNAGQEGNGDLLFGDAGNDTLIGGQANDVLSGGAGADELTGDEGSDTATYETASGSVTVSLATGSGSAGEAEGDVLNSIENLIGSDFNDILLGNTDANRLEGGREDDSLFGGAGSDVLIGGLGEDRLEGDGGDDTLDGGQNGDLYILRDAGDVVIEAAGNVGIDRLMATIDVVLGDADIETVILVGSLDTNATGNDSRNFLLGSLGANDLRGEGGDDRIDGAAGDDTLRGGAGNDTLDGGPGSDLFFVDDAGDRVAESRRFEGTDVVISSVDFRLGTAHVENLELVGDAILGAGNGLQNILTGNDGNNILDGGSNVDTLIGGLGDDTYLVRAPGDNAVEAANEGIDTVRAFRAYALDDNIENLFLQTLRNAAGEGISGINGIGNVLDNQIVGNPFDNVIAGREGSDMLRGQAGADTFVFDREIGADNVDRIIDFNTNETDEGDTLLFRSTVFEDVSTGVLSAANFATGTAAGDSSDRFIFNQASGQLWFDVDGNGANAQELVATFGRNANVEAEDIFIF